jgi:V8-like Glu-specific endopeptidase
MRVSHIAVAYALLFIPGGMEPARAADSDFQIDRGLFGISGVARSDDNLPLRIRVSGVASRSVIVEPGSSASRFRASVRVEQIAPGSQCLVSLIGLGSHLLWEQRLTAIGESWWTVPVTERRATLSLSCTTASSVAQVITEQLIIGSSEGHQEAVTPPNNLQVIRDATPTTRDAARAVVRLDVVDDGGEYSFPCTGFLISANLVITNEHCISTKREVFNAVAYFEDSTEPLRFDGSSAFNEQLDYVVCHLTTAVVDRAPLHLARTKIAAGEQFVIVEFPDGGAQKFSRIDCVAATAAPAGAIEFDHNCDTKSGSSGSPVIVDESHDVVGLHHFGFNKVSANLRNRAVLTTLILDDLMKTRRDYYDQIAAQP